MSGQVLGNSLVEMMTHVPALCLHAAPSDALDVRYGYLLGPWKYPVLICPCSALAKDNRWHLVRSWSNLGWAFLAAHLYRRSHTSGPHASSSFHTYPNLQRIRNALGTFGSLEDIPSLRWHLELTLRTTLYDGRTIP
jgi:hypothetical protein